MFDRVCSIFVKPTMLSMFVATGFAAGCGGVSEGSMGGTTGTTTTQGGFTPTGSLHAARCAHTATLLPSGKVLVAGGMIAGQVDGNIALSSAELYDPLAGTFTQTGNLTVTRGFHTATLLGNGEVLIAGGYDGTYTLASAELYDPQTGTFKATGGMSMARGNPAAALLPDGRVLIVGGSNFAGYIVTMSSAEVYDPIAGTFSGTGVMAKQRQMPSATTLNDGNVLIIGGEFYGPSQPTAEVYEPSAGVFANTGSPTVFRSAHTATLLSDGTVLLTGGVDSGGNLPHSAELYDATSGTFTATGTMALERYWHTAALLPSGKVLISGGEGASAELYDPVLGTFTVTGSMRAARLWHTATLLPSGEVLVIGGLIPAGGPFSTAGIIVGTPLATAELYE
jgi:WD40 repeat protein